VADARGDNCLVRPSLIATVLVASFATVALAADTVVAETHRATVDRDGKRVQVAWASIVPVDYATLTGRLAEAANTTALVSGEDVSIRVLRKDGRNADLRMERKTPFFLPDVWFEVRASILPDGDKTRIRWKRLDGTAKEFQREWTLRPDGEHTRVECRTLVQLPFNVPDFFAKRRIRQTMLEDMTGLARVAGASPRAPAAL
jgi:hypothetical protein